jgi:hypothetical protein
VLGVGRTEHLQGTERVLAGLLPGG